MLFDDKPLRDGLLLPLPRRRESKVARDYVNPRLRGGDGTPRKARHSRESRNLFPSRATAADFDRALWHTPLVLTCQSLCGTMNRRGMKLLTGSLSKQDSEASHEHRL